MAKIKKKKKKMKETYNVQLRWKKTDDKPAIKAIQAVAKKLGMDGTETLRFICLSCKKEAIEKANEYKKLLAG